MNLRIFAVALGLVVSGAVSPLTAAPQAASGGLLPFKGSYTGTYVVTSIPLANVVARGAGKITFVPMNAGQSAVLTIRGPYINGGTQYVFGATFRLLKNNTSRVNDGRLGFVPGHRLPASGLYELKSAKQISLTEAVKSGDITHVSTGTVRIAKIGGNKQRMVATISLASFGPTTVPVAYKLRFTVVGIAPKG